MNEVVKQLKIVQEPTTFGELSTNETFSFDKQGKSLFLKLSKTRAQNLSLSTRQTVESNETVYKVFW